MVTLYRMCICMPIHAKLVKYQLVHTAMGKTEIFITNILCRKINATHGDPDWHALNPELALLFMLIMGALRNKETKTIEHSLRS